MKILVIGAGLMGPAAAYRGWMMPEQIITGSLLERLVAELAAERIVFKRTDE